MARLGFLPRSIAGRLLMWFLLISLIPPVILAISMSILLGGGLREVSLDFMADAVESQIELLQFFEEERLGEVRAMGRSPVFRDLLSVGLDPTGVSESVITEDSAENYVAFEGILQELGFSVGLVVDQRETITFGSGAWRDLQSIAEPPIANTPLESAIRTILAGGNEAIFSAPHVYEGLNIDVPVLFVVGPVGSSEVIRGAIVVLITPNRIDQLFDVSKGRLETFDVYAGQRSGDEIRLVTTLRGQSAEGESGEAIQLAPGESTTRGEAMRLALDDPQNGEVEIGKGEVIGLDGERYLSAWGFEPRFQLGVVSEVAVDEALRPIRDFRIVSVGVIGVLGVFVVPIALLVSRRISRPIQHSAEIASLIAGGTLSRQVDQSGEGEVGVLLDSLKSMIDQLRRLIGKIQQSSFSLMSTASEIAATARQQHQTVQDYGASTSQVAAAVHEISATSQELSQTMTQVNDSAVSTGELAESGRTSLGQMQQTMQRLAEATSSVSSRLSVISERAGNINLVVTTITKVADQTNLLSINAAIEAEKAGEYGRGFLVVAREIRRLADQTATATLDIERIVQEMLESVSAGVMEMDKFHEQVHSGVQQAESLAEQLGQIIEAVRATLPRFGMVHEGMLSQVKGADQISDAMAQLRDGATRTTDSLEEFNRATKQLRDAVSDLQEDVSKFET